MSSGSKKKQPRYTCLSETKASHSQRMWAEVSSSAPHLLHSGSSDSPSRWRSLLRVLRPVRRPVTALDWVLLKDRNLVLAARQAGGQYISGYFLVNLMTFYELHSYGYGIEWEDDYVWWMWHDCKSISNVNPLNAELNPICYLLALLAHHFLHVSRIRVKSLTLRQLMSCVYIYIWSTYSWCL